MNYRSTDVLEAWEHNEIVWLLWKPQCNNLISLSKAKSYRKSYVLCAAMWFDYTDTESQMLEQNVTKCFLLEWILKLSERWYLAYMTWMILRPIITVLLSLYSRLWLKWGISYVRDEHKKERMLF